MKYTVELDAERHAVVIDNASVQFESEAPMHARLAEAEGSPLRTVKLGTHVYRVIVRRQPGKGRYTLWVDGNRFEAEVLDERTRAIRDISAVNAPPAGPAPILAPMPGLIIRINVSQGDRIEVGDGVVVMEAMKMENELRATTAGVVKNVTVKVGTAVEKGTLLVELE
jgi:biotin carboxyl carrier protein